MGRLEELKPVLAMVAVVVVCAVMNVLVKASMDEGMGLLPYVTLHMLVAALFMAPIAYFRERGLRPRLTTEIVVYLFLIAMVGPSLAQYLFFLGSKYTSATFACAFQNMVPVITFFVALPFGLEKLNVKRKPGIAKLLGMVICLIGAMLLTFYKGAALANTTEKPMALDHKSERNDNTRKWMVGSISLLASCLCFALWFLLQSKLGEKYPVRYSSSGLVFIISFLQVAILSLALQRDFSISYMKMKLVIITILFSELLILEWFGVLRRGVQYSQLHSIL